MPRRFTAVCPILVLALLLAGCGANKQVRQASSALPPMGYTIQAGAFAEVDNAGRLTRTLKNRGLDAYYFRHSSGLYKVRFGDYPRRDLALATARTLKKAGIIDVFYVVNPTEYALHKARGRGNVWLRGRLVHTARSFIGVPYRWGGTNPRTGFDCSGLAQAVYQYNGLKLPRTSREQFKAGRKIRKRRLRPGDLVFFATGKSRRRITHVGIYAGDDMFIHAPRTGRRICTASLKSPYFRKTYVGACTYLR